MPLEKFDVHAKMSSLTNQDDKTRLAKKYISVYAGVEAHKQFALIKKHMGRHIHVMNCKNPDCKRTPLTESQELYMLSGLSLHCAYQCLAENDKDQVMENMAEYKSAAQDMMFDCWENVENNVHTSIGIVSDNKIENISGEEAYRKMCDYEKVNLIQLEDMIELANQCGYFE